MPYFRFEYARENAMDAFWLYHSLNRAERAILRVGFVIDEYILAGR